MEEENQLQKLSSDFYTHKARPNTCTQQERKNVLSIEIRAVLLENNWAKQVT